MLFNQNNVKQYHVLLSQYKTNHKHLLVILNQIYQQIIKQALQLNQFRLKQALLLKPFHHHLKQEGPQDKFICFNKKLHHLKRN